MASIRKLGAKWQVQISKNGVRSSKSFVTKAAAMAWAVAQEAEIDTVQNGGLPNKTFGELLERYRDEVVPTVKKEVVRINRFVRDEDLAKVKVASLNSTHVATWRNKRLLEVHNLVMYEYVTSRIYFTHNLTPPSASPVINVFLTCAQ